MKNHVSKKLKYISDSMNQFTAIPATLSKNLYFDLSTNSNLASPCHLSHLSTRVKGEQNCTKLVHNPKSLYILWNKYKLDIRGQQPAKTFSKKKKDGQVQLL